MKTLFHLICALVCLGVSSTSRGSILIDFDNAPVHTSLPVDVSAGGITAHLAATAQGFSIQQANTLGFTPVGFSGLCVYPNSVFAADLAVGFSETLTDFSILYAPEEYACDSSARMRVTAYMNGVLVGTNTTTAQAGTWPTATLAISAASGFNSVVVHYDAPPPTGGDWGPIFMADNINVTVAVPEPASWVELALVFSGVITLRRRGGRRLHFTSRE